MVNYLKIYLYKFVSLLNHMKSHPLWSIEWWVIHHGTPLEMHRKFQVGPWAVDRLLWRLGWLGELTGGHAIPGGTDGKMADSLWKKHGKWGEIWWNPRKINRISWNLMKGHWFHPSFFGGITWNNGVTELFTMLFTTGMILKGGLDGRIPSMTVGKSQEKIEKDGKHIGISQA